MSSGTKYESTGGRDTALAMGDKVMNRIATLGMTPRQQELNRLFAWYRCQQYEARRCDWDGKEHVAGVDHEAIATAGILPPGFYDAGASLPIKFRRPSTPYHLVRVIVNRFTELLFSESHHPTVHVAGNPDAADVVNELVNASRLWAVMIQARALGGSMGTVAVGFQIVDGKLSVEVFDPRWSFPEFEDRFAGKLSAIEIRYMYPVEERDPETGKWIEVAYWYRRVIDAQADVLYKAVPVGDGSEPFEWPEKQRVEHGLGFCPVVWVQNLPVQDSIDGDPDCQGTYEMIESLDALLAQAHLGTLGNCDPTLVIVSNAPLGEIRKGSDNALRLPPGSTAQYLELQGASIKIALEQADNLRDKVLEVVQCVVERSDTAGAGGARTATEVVRNYSSMLAKVGVLREQYGERGVKPLLEMMLLALQRVTQPREVEGQVVRGAVFLRPKLVDGKLVPRQVPQGQVALELQWPPYFEPTPAETDAAVRAAGAAKNTGLVDQEHAAASVAPYFNVDDVPAMLARLKEEAAEQMASFNLPSDMLPPKP